MTFADCGDLFDGRSAETKIPAERLSQLTFACAILVVPVDHSQPDGDQIPMQIIHVTNAAEETRIGSLEMNPGGPGLSGVAYLS